MFTHIYYPIILLLLILCEYVYLRIAHRYNIIDRHTHRGSSQYVVVRGGGVIFYVAVLLYMLFHASQWTVHGWFFVGLTLLATISMTDDIKEVHPLPRLIVQVIAVMLLLVQCGVLCCNAWWYIASAFIVCVGIINAYNFMDGINGITPAYSLVTLITLSYVNQYLLPQPFISEPLLHTVTFAVMVFGYYNFRNKALCIAGDVGSVSIAFLITYIMVRLIEHTGNYAYLIFLAVYGVDVVLTIVHRIMLRENISEAHRKHLYQILANELRWRHLSVSLIYAAMQVAISVGLLLIPTSMQYYYAGAVLFVLCLGYTLFMRRYFHLHKL